MVLWLTLGESVEWVLNPLNTANSLQSADCDWLVSGYLDIFEPNNNQT